MCALRSPLSPGLLIPAQGHCRCNQGWSCAVRRDLAHRLPVGHVHTRVGLHLECVKSVRASQTEFRLGPRECDVGRSAHCATTGLDPCVVLPGSNGNARCHCVHMDLQCLYCLLHACLCLRRRAMSRDRGCRTQCIAAANVEPDTTCDCCLVHGQHHAVKRTGILSTVGLGSELYSGLTKLSGGKFWSFSSTIMPGSPCGGSCPPVNVAPTKHSFEMLAGSYARENDKGKEEGTSSFV